jgi:hypothetical protein
VNLFDQDPPYPDPMMDELRIARETVAAKLAQVSVSQRANWVSQETERLLSERNCLLEPHPNLASCSIIVKRPDASNQQLNS